MKKKGSHGDEGGQPRGCGTGSSIAPLINEATRRQTVASERTRPVAQSWRPPGRPCKGRPETRSLMTPRLLCILLRLLPSRSAVRTETDDGPSDAASEGCYGKYTEL
ncbi:hypothetical protein MTO96_018453 [Rhipicephalus appendiculatus]